MACPTCCDVMSCRALDCGACHAAGHPCRRAACRPGPGRSATCLPMTLGLMIHRRRARVVVRSRCWELRRPHSSRGWTWQGCRSRCSAVSGKAQRRPGLQPAAPLLPVRQRWPAAQLSTGLPLQELRLPEERWTRSALVAAAHFCSCLRRHWALTWAVMPALAGPPGVTCALRLLAPPQWPVLTTMQRLSFTNVSDSKTRGVPTPG